MKLEDRILEENNGDVFFTKAIYDYFVRDLNMSESDALPLFDKVSSDKLIYNDFSKYVIQNTFDFDTTLSINGVTAKMIHEENPDLCALDVYLKLIDMNDKANDSIDLDAVINDVFEKILNMEEEETTCISDEVGTNLSDKELFYVYNGVVNKLKKEQVFLDFIDKGVAGLPFNIHFKRGTFLTIKLSEKRYNGKYGKGSIFSNIIDFNLCGNNACVSSFMEVCVDPTIKERGKLGISIPFVMTEDELKNLNDCLAKVSTINNIAEEEYIKLSIPEKLRYVDLYINSKHFYINSLDSILFEIATCIKSDIVTKTNTEAYKDLFMK